MQKLYKPEQVFLYFITGRHIIFYCFITYIVVHSFCNIRIVWLVIKRIKLTLFYPIATQISLKYRIYILEYDYCPNQLHNKKNYFDFFYSLFRRNFIFYLAFFRNLFKNPSSRHDKLLIFFVCYFGEMDQNMPKQALDFLILL